MKKSKGTYKEHSRYLDSEYYDYSLETEDVVIKSVLDLTIKQATSLQEENEREQVRNEYLQHKNKTSEFCFGPKISVSTPLTDAVFENLANLLGFKRREVLYGLHQFQMVQSPQLKQAFESIYCHFETVPVVFLSITYNKETKQEKQDFESKIEAVYLWQVNRYAPFNLPNTIMTNVRLQITNKYNCPSLLLLATFVPDKGEEILEARLLDDVNLVIRARDLQTNNIKITLYDTPACYWSSFINPSGSHLVMNNNFKHRLVLEGVNKPGAEPLEFSLWRKKTMEEIQIDSTGLDQNIIDIILIKRGTLPNSIDEHSFSEILKLPNQNRIVLLDKKTSTFLLWDNEDIKLKVFNEIGAVTNIKICDNFYFASTEQGKIFTFTIDNLDQFYIKDIGITIPPVTEDKEGRCSPRWDIVSIRSSASLRENFYFVYYSDMKFYGAPLEDLSSPKVILDIRERMQGSKEIGWNVLTSNYVTNPLLICIYHDYLHIYDPTTQREKVIRLYLQGSDLELEKIQVIASHKAYIAGHTAKTNEIVLLEIDLNPDLNILFNEGYKPTVKIVLKNKKDGEPRTNWILSQVGGLMRGITFIRVINQIIYYDKENLMKGLVIPSTDGKNTKKQPEENMEFVEEEYKDDKEKEILTKMQIAKKSFNQYHDSNEAIKEANKALAEVRRGIESKIKDFMEHESKAQQLKNNYYSLEKMRNLNNQKLQNVLEIQDKIEKDISSQYKNLYEDIKNEKKIITKERDKKKSYKKKNRQAEIEL